MIVFQLSHRMFSVEWFNLGREIIKWYGNESEKLTKIEISINNLKLMYQQIC